MSGAGGLFPPNCFAFLAARSRQDPVSWNLFRAGSEQAVLKSVEGQFQAVGDAELVEDGRQVVLDGLFADEQLLRDVPVLVALHYQFDDFHLARRKLALAVALAFRCQASKGRQNRLSEAPVQPDLPLIHLAQALPEQL